MKNTHTDQVIRIVEGRARSEQPTGRLCAELEGEAAKQEKTNKPMTKNSSRRAVGAALYYCFHRASAYSLKNKRQQCGGQAAFVTGDANHGGMIVSPSSRRA